MKSSDLYVIYGRNYGQMAYEILEKAGAAQDFKSGMRVGIKPNLVVAKKAGEGATTSPEVVEGVIRYVKDHGVDDIAIMEGSWVGDSTKRAFKTCGYEELARKYGLPLYDLKDDDFVIRRVADLDIKICKRPLEVDYLINMPVLKAHCQTQMTCALKNLKGCLPDSEKRKFHSLGLHKPIGCLSKALKTGITLVDAICGDLTFEEGGNPVQMDRLIAGRDPVLVDAYAASLLGFSKEDIPYIGIAESVGAGSADLERANIFEYDVGLKRGDQFRPSNRARQLARNVVEKDACSACYGSLIHALHRLADKNKLSLLREKVYIGQAFRGQVLDGIGIGACTHRCSKHVGGCPPAARDIVEFLESQCGIK